jgi:hypothetical protein
LLASFDDQFDEYLRRVAEEWASYIASWERRCDVLLVRYEDLLRDARGELLRTLDWLSCVVPEQDISTAIAENSFVALKRKFDQTFKINTFFRKGTAGQWLQHFSAQNLIDFDSRAGETLKSLGYR